MESCQQIRSISEPESILLTETVFDNEELAVESASLLCFT